MQSQPPYPLFVPPGECAAKPHREWSRREALQYLSWLTTEMDARVDGLLGYFGMPRDTEWSATSLTNLGALVSQELARAEFSELAKESSRRLTNRGYSLAADMGLLAAGIIVRNSGGRARWEVLTRPKSDASYNLPVLTGFGRLRLDPIGGSVAEAIAILDGRRGSDAWARIVDHWIGLLASVSRGAPARDPASPAPPSRLSHSQSSTDE